MKMEEPEENVNADDTEEDDTIKYTLPQRIFIYETYVINECVKICQREFRKSFPDVPPPKKSRILRLAKNFRTTGLLIDAKKIEDKHIKELEIEAEENKKRKVAIPVSVLESNVNDQNSASELGAEDISSMIKTEIKSEPSISSEPDTASNGFEFVHIKKEPKEDGLDDEGSVSSSKSDEPSAAPQAPEWGLVEESPAPTTFPTSDALPYPCRHCGCCFRTYADLKSHITELHAQMIKCKECGKEFPTRTQFQRHEAQHMTKPPFTCIECHKVFMSQSKLNTHNKKEHVKSEKPEEEKRRKKKKR